MRAFHGLSSGSAGYSLIEVVAATALTLALTAIAFALIEPVRAAFAAQPEAADMQQRLRVASGALYNDLLMAGAGVAHGPNPGPLVHYFAPILPYRRGTNDDAPGMFREDALTLMYVPQTLVQTTLASSGPDGPTADIIVNDDPGCPLNAVPCGIKNGMDLLLYDGTGLHDSFRVRSVAIGSVHVEGGGGGLTYSAFPPDTTTVAEVRTIVYYLKSDATTGVGQLVAREGVSGFEVPVVDHLVALSFDYFGDPVPPSLTAGDPHDIAASYGPSPPPLEEQIPTGGYPAGENCTFSVDAVSGEQVPRLPLLDPGGSASGLVLLTSAQLTDGPWCPDAGNAHRWDADLLRVRAIRVTLRIEAADPAVRGPAGILFANAGTSRNGTRWLPDLTIRFQVAPRNLARPR